MRVCLDQAVVLRAAGRDLVLVSPGRRLLQNVHAFVTLHPGADSPAAGELRRFAGDRLSRQMVPERIHVAVELPRTGAGKIDRDRLQWQAEAGTTTG